MKKKYKIIIAAALLTVAVVYGIYTTMTPVAVESETIATAPMGDSFTAQGTLEPLESRIVTATTSGTVSKLAVRAGGRVAQGDTLLTLDDSALNKDLQQQIDTLKLQQSAAASETSIRREQIKQQLEGAEIEYYRQFGNEVGSAAAVSDLALSSYMLARNAYYDAEELYDDLPPGVSSVLGSRDLFALEQQMVSARKNFIITRNSTDDTNKAYYTALIDSFRSQLGMMGNYSAQQLQITIDYLEDKLNPDAMAAPFDGIVWETYVQEGGFVAQDTPVARVFKDDGMKLTARLLSEDTTGLTVGDVVDCALTDGSTFTAKVTFVSPVAEQTVSGIGLSENRCTVELSPVELPKQAGAGYQVDLTFRSVALDAAHSVAASAILPAEGGSAVYLLRGGKAVLTPVETGMRVGGRVEILSGVQDGDIVITSPQDSRVKNGMRVKG